jgi:hypothetical protein
VGPAGLEPALPGLKVRCLSNSATTPCVGRTYPFQSRCIEHRSTPQFPWASSPGWTRTDHRRRIRSPCFLYNTGPGSVGMVGLEPTTSCFQGTQACRCPTSRLSVRTAGIEPAISWPPARRNTRLSHVLSVSSSYGNRTHLTALKGQYPQPIDERAMSVRTIYAQWAGGRSNPRLLVLSQVPTNLRSVPASQLPAQRKKPDVVVTPGFVCSRRGKAKRHKRKGCMGSVFAG